MRLYFILLFLLALAACAENSTNSGTTTSIDSITVDITNYLTPHGDTIISLPDTVYTDVNVLYISEAGAVDFQNYSAQNTFEDSLLKQIGNYHEIIVAWEQHLQNTYKDMFSVTDTTLVLYLENNMKLTLPRIKLESIDIPSHHFYHYFPGLDYVLLHTQYYEGNTYKLVNRKTGYVKELNGKPYFSPDKKHMLTANIDLEAHFDYNGLEYYAVEQDTLRKIFSYEPEGWWGPEDIQWTSDSTAYIRAGYVIYAPDSAYYQSKNLLLRIGYN